MKNEKSNKIQFCPNCTAELHNDRELAQGVKKCIACGCNFFIIITSENNKIII